MAKSASRSLPNRLFCYMISLSDIFPPVVWSRSLCSSSPESLMNTHINVPRAREEIIGTSLGSSATHVSSISVGQAVAL